MMSFMAYNGSVSGSTPPQAYFRNVEFNGIFHDMNSLIHFNQGGNVTFEYCKFYYVSTCGGIISNENPTVYNWQPDSETYTEYLTNYNRQIYANGSKLNNTKDYKLNMTGCTFMSFNYLKTLSTYGIFINELNGNVHRGVVVHLNDFRGNVTLSNNIISDIRTNLSSCAAE